MTDAKFQQVLVFGLGGTGGRIVKELAAKKSGEWLQLACADTDVRDLEFVDGVLQMPLGRDWANGLGCGGDAVFGENLAGLQTGDFKDLLANCDLTILVGGLGGGTASGGLQVVNRLLREQEQLSLTFVTLPLTSEGSERGDTARQALEALRRHDDVVIAVENELIFQQLPRETPLPQALGQANRLIADGLEGLAAMVRCRNGIPVDYANLRTLLRERPAACSFGTGRVAGPERSKAVVNALFDAPLLGGREFLQEAHVVVGALYGGPSLSVSDMDGCLGELQRQLNPLTRTLLGACAMPEGRDDEVCLTILAIQYDRPSDRVDRSSTALVRRAKTMKLTTTGTMLPAVRSPDGVLGIFGNSLPTVRRGENLDIPTFLREGITLEMVRESTLGDERDDEESDL